MKYVIVLNIWLGDIHGGGTCTDSFPTRINKTNKPQTSQVISESESIVGGGVCKGK